MIHFFVNVPTRANRRAIIGTRATRMGKHNELQIAAIAKQLEVDASAPAPSVSAMVCKKVGSLEISTPLWNIHVNAAHVANPAIVRSTSHAAEHTHTRLCVKGKVKNIYWTFQ
jgi:hypothetical protein